MKNKSNSPLIIKAINMAAEAHRDQFRRGSKLPYIIHPVTVLALLNHFKISKHQEELSIAAILHDCVEDTSLTLDQIHDEFGDMVVGLVKGLTSDPEQLMVMGKSAYLEQKMIYILTSYELTLKLLDRLANIMDNPTDGYCSDTLKLLKALSKKRKLSKTQKRIVKEIRRTIKIRNK